MSYGYERGLSLTQDRLKELIHYDQETGIFTWKHRSGRGGGFSGRKATCLKDGGYVVIRVDYRLYKAHRLAWLYVYGRWPEKIIDHINRNKSDNRICNLRECNHSQNCINGKRLINNQSGHRGVTYKNEKHRKRQWKASIIKDGKSIHLGYFMTKEEAVIARAEANIRLFGEFGENHS